MAAHHGRLAEVIHRLLWGLLGLVLLFAGFQLFLQWRTAPKVVAGDPSRRSTQVIVPASRLPVIVHPTPRRQRPTPSRMMPTPSLPLVHSLPSPTPPAPPPPEVVATARKYGIDTSGRYIVVDQARQQMYIVEGNTLVRVLPVSTGDPTHGFFTPAWVGRVGVYWGTFTAHGVYADNAWHLFQAPGGNILIHGLPYILDASGRKIYQDANALGKTPVSRGCIRLRPDDAEWFTRWGPAGVPIVILPHPAQTSEQQEVP